MPKTKGWKQIAEMEWSGSKFPIRVSAQFGIFEIEVPTKDPLHPKIFSGKDLEKLRNEVSSFLSDQTKLAWAPMIYIKNNRNGGGDIGLALSIYFKAKRGDGTEVWRCDKSRRDEEPEMGEDGETDTDFRYGTLIPYTKETWKKVVDLASTIHTLHEIVSSGIHQKNVEALLQIFSEGGLEKLMSNPRHWHVTPFRV